MQNFRRGSLLANSQREKVKAEENPTTTDLSDFESDDELEDEKGASAGKINRDESGDDNRSIDSVTHT